MPETKKYFECCLYFTASSLARAVTRMADEEFNPLGLSTSHAFLLMLVIEQPGITQKELTKHLNLAQSTVSRFVDALEARGFLEKKPSGKQVNVFPTVKGTEQLEGIHAAWGALYERYSRILGKEAGDELTQQTLNASWKLAE